MEIDLSEVPQGNRLDRVLEAIDGLATGDVLTLLSADNPQPLAEELKRIHGEDLDLQRLRWGGKTVSWRLHIKKSRMPSAYQPED
jgi:uncharacterized protein (DUF2249 family)